VQRFMPELLGYIADGRMKPHEIISHRMPLSEAANGYRIFDKREDDCRKVVLTP
jgi:threonine dehydrogenase-like Zn-dependent dehydrogenase